MNAPSSLFIQQWMWFGTVLVVELADVVECVGVGWTLIVR